MAIFISLKKVLLMLHVVQGSGLQKESSSKNAIIAG